jgi:hypothetical protein
MARPACALSPWSSILRQRCLSARVIVPRTPRCSWGYPQYFTGRTRQRGTGGGERESAPCDALLQVPRPGRPPRCSTPVCLGWWSMRRMRWAVRRAKGQQGWAWGCGSGACLRSVKHCRLLGDSGRGPRPASPTRGFLERGRGRSRVPAMVKLVCERALRACEALRDSGQGRGDLEGRPRRATSKGDLERSTHPGLRAGCGRRSARLRLQLGPAAGWPGPLL